MNGAPDDAMLEIPAGFRLARSVEFDHATVPTGLLRAHRVASDRWARLTIVEGALIFVFEDRGAAERQLVEGGVQVIPPDRPHRLVIDGDVRFTIEFHAPD